MATYSGIGGAQTYTSGQASGTVPQPSPAAGDLEVLIVATKPATMTPGTITGWTQQATKASTNATAYAADTGPTRITVYTKDAPCTGSEGTAAVTVPFTGNVASCTMWARILKVSRSVSGAVLTFAAATAEDATGGTSWSASYASGIDHRAGDLCINALAITTDTLPTFTVDTVTSTGATYTSTFIQNPVNSAATYDIGGRICWLSLTGTASSSATRTMTLSGTTTNDYGPEFILRIREDPAVNVTNDPTGLVDTDAIDVDVSDQESLGLTDDFGATLIGQEFTADQQDAGNLIDQWSISIDRDVTDATGISDAGAGTVGFDAVGPSSSGQVAATASSLTWQHVCSGTDRVVYVSCALGIQGDGGRSMVATYADQAMTSLGVRHSNDSTDGFVQLWRLVNPPTGASTVLVTVTGGAATLTGGSVSFIGVDGSAPEGTPVPAVGNMTLPVAVIPTGSDDSMVLAVVANGSFIGPSGQTTRYTALGDNNSAAGNSAVATALGTGSPVTLTWPNTSVDWWATIGVEVLPAVSSGVTIDRSSDQDVQDNQALVDQFEVSGQASRQESLGLTDEVNASRLLLLDSQDGLGLTDRPALSGQVSRQDLQGLADQQALAAGDDTQELLGLTDVRAIQFGPSSQDALGLTEARAVEASKVVQDAAGLVDQVTTAAVGVMDRSDSLGITDSVTHETLFGAEIVWTYDLVI